MTDHGAAQDRKGPDHRHGVEGQREGSTARGCCARTGRTLGTRTVVVRRRLLLLTRTGPSHGAGAYRTGAGWPLHGHVHSEWQVRGRRINDGVNVWDLPCLYGYAAPDHGRPLVITALQNLTVEDYLSIQSATPAAPVYVWAAERHKGRPARFLVRYDGGPRVQVGVVVKLPANSCGPRAFLASRWSAAWNWSIRTW